MDKKNHIQKSNYYIHFKGYLASNYGSVDNPNIQYLYKVLETNALHCENMAAYVVYQNVMNGQVWIRCVEDFTSSVDRNKYPDVPESITFRFTPISDSDLRCLCRKNNISIM